MFKYFSFFCRKILLFCLLENVGNWKLSRKHVFDSLRLPNYISGVPLMNIGNKSYDVPPWSQFRSFFLSSFLSCEWEKVQLYEKSKWIFLLNDVSNEMIKRTKSNIGIKLAGWKWALFRVKEMIHQKKVLSHSLLRNKKKKNKKIVFL